MTDMLRAVTLVVLVTGCLTQSPIFTNVCRSVIANLDCTTGYLVKNLCGTDGMLYKTECHFAVAHCHAVNLDVDVTNGCLVKMTSASPKPTAVVSSSAVTSTVGQGTSNMTPTASSHASNASTVIPTPAPTFSGACRVLTALTCQDTLDEVCGTDLQTYDNPCKFEVAKCYNQKLAMKSKGACKPTATDIICKTIKDKDCPPEDEELCGTDGKNYPNICELEKAKCATPSVRIAAIGHC